MALEIKDLSLDLFMRWLREKQGIGFARYGDGTFYCLQGVKGANCDGVVYTQAQAKALYRTLKDDKIIHSIGDMAIRHAKAEAWLAEQNIQLEWYDCNVLNTASYQGELYPFIDFLRTKTNIIIGPSHLKRLKAFPVAEHIVCPPTTAFDVIEDLSSNAYAAATVYEAHNVLISAGVGAAPTLVSWLHAALPHCNVIDCGSVWDMYVGVLSRKRARKLGKTAIEKLGRANFDKEIGSWWVT